MSGYQCEIEANPTRRSVDKHSVLIDDPSHRWEINMTMRINCTIVGLALTVASSAAYMTLATTPSKQQVQKQESTVERDPYCPTKQERGKSCSGAKTDRCTPLMRAAQNGRIKEVRALLSSRVDVNAAREVAGETALMFAASEGHLEIVKALLAAGANPNAIGGTFHYGPFVAWMSALNRCNKNWLDIFDAMLAAGVELNPTMDVYFSPLGYAISKQEDPVMIEALVKRGADVNIKDSARETPLMFAVRYSSADVVTTLIGANADVNARNKKGESVLTIAEKSDNQWQREILLMLSKAGAKR